MARSTSWFPAQMLSRRHYHPQWMRYESCSLLAKAIAMISLIVGLNSNTRGALASEINDSFAENPYTHLWASQDGESHIAECKMQNFTSINYVLLKQYTRYGFGGVPQKMVFTEMGVNMTQGLHNPPTVQFVITLSNSWYVKTTDGTMRVMLPGDVLFQDNTIELPAKKNPQHYSGVLGDSVCHQFICQFNRTPEMDHPCPF